MHQDPPHDGLSSSRGPNGVGKFFSLGTLVVQQTYTAIAPLLQSPTGYCHEQRSTESLVTSCLDYQFGNLRGTKLHFWHGSPASCYAQHHFIGHQLPWLPIRPSLARNYLFFRVRGLSVSTKNGTFLLSMTTSTCHALARELKAIKLWQC